jgi:transposase-like protein
MEHQEKFPQTLLEAIRHFTDPDNCLNFMVSMRWPDGITCPRCQSKQANFIKTRRLWICKDCKKNFTVKVGTIMEDSAIGLDKWLTAIWMIANDKNGISSYEIHRSLGITQKSAWFLLHRIRLAMQNGSLESSPVPSKPMKLMWAAKLASCTRASAKRKSKVRAAQAKQL